MYIEYLPGEKHASSHPERSDSQDAFADAGYELTDQNIVIDIDHAPKETIQAILDWFHITTMVTWTERGAHLWFNKPAWFTRRRDGVCRLGISVEQHTKASRPNGMTIKRKGVMRKVDNFGIFATLPDIFIVNSKKSSFEDLMGIEEGDARNNKLFSHRRKLGDCDGWQQILKFINQHVFAQPLDDAEMSGIMRDMPKGEIAGDDKYQIADQIRAERGVVKYSSLMWYRDDEGHYTTDANNEHLIKIVYEKCPGQDTRFVDEVIKQIKYRADMIPAESAFPIVLQNGIVNNGKFLQVEGYQGFSPYYIPIVYDPEAPPVTEVDEYLDRLTGDDMDYRRELEEVMGFVMVTDQEKVRALGRFFMFRGDGRNGKGTFLQILKTIYGAKNCTTLSIKQMTDDRYKVTMVGKLVNLGDDIEAEAINNDQLKVLKNITTADSISTRRLYNESETSTITAKLIFTTNDSNKAFEKGYAYQRRVKWMPMFNKIEKVDPNFVYKLTTPAALRYWIRLIVAAYIRLYSNGDWTASEAVDRFNEAYHEENNPAVAFARDMDPEMIKGHTISEVKEMYLDWFGDKDAKVSGKEIEKAIRQHLHLEIRNGRDGDKRGRLFLPEKNSLTN